MFPVEVAAVELDNLQLRLKSANYIRFQADTGAQCNVIPLKCTNKQQVTLA